MSINKIEYVSQALNAGLGNWVLFSGGTFIVFRDVMPDDNLAEMAISFLHENGRLQVGDASADFMVTPLLHTTGWVVRGVVDGLYVYVHPSEINNPDPDDLQIGLYARTIRQNDYEYPKIIHINRDAS